MLASGFWVTGSGVWACLRGRGMWYTGTSRCVAVEQAGRGGVNKWPDPCQYTHMKLAGLAEWQAERLRVAKGDEWNAKLGVGTLGRRSR